MLDFAIRHYTANRYSLDDVVRRLYDDYYKTRKRGFTEDEFKKLCQAITKNDLKEIFEYAYTTKELDYKKYFNYGGLDIQMNDRSFQVNPLANPDKLQMTILNSWSAKQL